MMVACGMLFALLLIALVTDSAIARDFAIPQISLAISTGEANRGALEPHLKWEASKSSGELDLEAGLDVRVENFETMPYSVWGRIKRTIGNGKWTVSARGVVDSLVPDCMDVDLKAKSDSTNILLIGRTDRHGYSLDMIKIQHEMDAPGGFLVLKPRFNLGTSMSDMTIGYNHKDGYGIEVSGNKRDQKLTLSRLVGDRTIISPSFTTSGDFCLDCSRRLDGAGTATASLRPGDSITVQWQDGPWLASVLAPLDGFKVGHAKLTVKRHVDI